MCIAISNHRLIAFTDGKVTFRWKDYAHGSKQRLMRLGAARGRAPRKYCARNTLEFSQASRACDLLSKPTVSILQL